MEDKPRIVGTCTELVEGKECGGNLKENIVSIVPSFSFLAIFLVFGSTKVDGYVCDKCGSKTPLTDTGDQINSLTTR